MSKTVEEVASSLQNFGWTDYSVFALMLLSSLGIGVYFSYADKKKRRQTAVSDYLVGGRTMKVFPVSISLTASLISGIGLLGTSTEMYIYGYHLVFFICAFPLAMLVVSNFMLPVYHELRLTSMYEYLERRFGRSLRLFGSMAFLFTTFFRIPIQIYVPSLAFSQVTGADIYLTTILICLICIIYTCIGGLKAVVWTDVIQGFIMLGALIIVTVKATYDLGGLGVVIERNLNSTRIEAPIFDLDPTVRNSFWAAIIGGTFYNMAGNGIEQSMIQRYVSLPTLKDARKAAWIFGCSTIIITFFALYNGLILYAMYHDCDPISTGLVQRKDQLVPLLVMEVSGQYPFLSGCFMAGVFSASLSTLSTGLNSMTAVILEDFVKQYFNPSERSTNFIMKGTVIVIGVVTTLLVFVVEKLGTVLSLALSLGGTMYGPLLGVYIIGLSMPWLGSNPTLAGAASGLLVTGWIVFKSQADTVTGILSFAEKPVSTDGCLYFFNQTVPEPIVESEKAFYHISYFCYTLVGVIVTLFVANVWCLVFGKQDSRKVALELLTPSVRRFYERQNFKKCRKDEAESVKLTVYQ